LATTLTQHRLIESGGASVVYDGDPLHDLALSAFLDKFVRRKAKVCSDEAADRCEWCRSIHAVRSVDIANMPSKR
jgi:hypothetical protein